MSPALFVDEIGVRPKSRSLVVILIGLAYLGLTACYLIATVSASRTASFKLDEVLAVWAARLPTFTDVIGAIWHGSEFSPPTYDMILHAIFGIFGSERLVARLPSIISILVAAAALAHLATRRLNDARLGILVFGLVLDSRLFYFAIQARPYALQIAIQAIALLIWSGYPDRKFSAIRAASIAACLTASISLHVYGIIGLFAFALMEGLWSLAKRRLRLPIWGALFLAGLVSLAWLPLIAHLATFNSGDTSAPQYYARPTLDTFLNALIGLSPLREIIIASAGLVAGSFLIQFWRGRIGPSSREPADTAVWSMTLALLAVLPLAFFFSMFVTRSFSLRYALPAAMGSALFVALFIRRCPHRETVALLMVPVMCYGLYTRERAPDYTARFLEAVASYPAADPIVVGDGGTFVEMMEGASPEVRRRLVFLTSPPGLPVLDLTNEHQVLRLKSFLPDLPVKDPLAFIADHPSFSELVFWNTAPDPIMRWVSLEHWASTVEVRAPDCLIRQVKVETPRANAL